MGHIETFVGTCRAFTDWCVQVPDTPEQDAQTVHQLLLRLCEQAGWLTYPSNVDYALKGNHVDDETWRRVFKRAGNLPFNFYGMLFNPHVIPPEEAGIGDLAGDIADIFRDISKGISLFDQGHKNEAEYNLLSSFCTHWGHHAASAIYALNTWLCEHSRAPWNSHD